jgi:hypothetical protein
VMLRGRKSIGICLGSVVAFAGEHGLERLPLAACAVCYPLGWPEA